MHGLCIRELINTKIIVLSSEFYKKGKYSQVVNTDLLYHNQLKQLLKPKYYIIAEHTGNHYKLLNIKKSIFRFHRNSL